MTSFLYPYFLIFRHPWGDLKTYILIVEVYQPDIGELFYIDGCFRDGVTSRRIRLFLKVHNSLLTMGILQDKIILLKIFGNF